MAPPKIIPQAPVDRIAKVADRFAGLPPMVVAAALLASALMWTKADDVALVEAGRALNEPVRVEQARYWKVKTDLEAERLALLKEQRAAGVAVRAARSADLRAREAAEEE